jgi:hypothetical protein
MVTNEWQYYFKLLMFPIISEFLSSLCFDHSFKKEVVNATDDLIKAISPAHSSFLVRQFAKPLYSSLKKK